MRVSNSCIAVRGEGLQVASEQSRFAFYNELSAALARSGFYFRVLIAL